MTKQASDIELLKQLAEAKGVATSMVTLTSNNI